MPAMQHRWTTTEVRALIDESCAWPRYELLDGELIVTPAPGNGHQIAVTEIWSLLSAFVDQHQLGVALISPADLELRPGTISQPDVFVAPLGTHETPDPPDDWSNVKSLFLAVEIISPSSIHTDRVAKRDHYLGVGVPEYWVVDLDARVVERWKAERETPLISRSTIEWRPVGAKESLSIDLERLFETIRSKARRLGAG